MKNTKEISYTKIRVWSSVVAIVAVVLSSCASSMHGTAREKGTSDILTEATIRMNLQQSGETPSDNGVTAQGSEDLSCTLPFTFSSEVFETRIVLLGDLHGTREALQLAAELVCTLSRKDTPVTLAIEMPHEEQTALNAYLTSDGGNAARSALIASPFWRLRRDGLNTVATLAMIDRIRELRQRGAPLTILAIDASSYDFTLPLPKITPEQEQRVYETMKGMDIENKHR